MLTVPGLAGALPLLAVINDGFHAILSLQDLHWAGPHGFTEILQSDRFLASLAGSLLSSTRAQAIREPPGYWAAVWVISGTPSPSRSSTKKAANWARPETPALE